MLASARGRHKHLKWCRLLDPVSSRDDPVDQESCFATAFALTVMNRTEEAKAWFEVGMPPPLALVMLTATKEWAELYHMIDQRVREHEQKLAHGRRRRGK